jgi:hypothetical protein
MAVFVCHKPSQNQSVRTYSVLGFGTICCFKTTSLRAFRPRARGVNRQRVADLDFEKIFAVEAKER